MKKAIICFLGVIIMYRTGHALTWSEVAAIGLKNSHNLVAAQKQLESTEWSYRKSLTTFFPQLSANAGYSQDLITEGNPQTYSEGLSASENLFQGFADIYGMQSAYANLEFQKADYQASEASVMYDLRSAYITLATAKENVDILKQILDQRSQNSSMIQLRYDGGNEDKGNLMTTKADEAAARADLVSAQRDLDLAWLKLSQLLGQNVSGEIASVTPSSAEAADIYYMSKQTPDYVKAQKTYELADLSQKTTISEFLPTLQLRLSDNKTGATWPPSDNTDKALGLNLSYDFFPGGSNIADRAIAGANLDKAKETLEQTLNDLVYTLKTSYTDYRDALDSLEVAKQSLAASAERSKISNAKYQNGLTTYDEWTLIQDSYIQAQKGLVSAERAALLAEASWYKSYGGWVK